MCEDYGTIDKRGADDDVLTSHGLPACHLTHKLKFTPTVDLKVAKSIV